MDNNTNTSTTTKSYKLIEVPVFLVTEIALLSPMWHERMVKGLVPQFYYCAPKAHLKIYC